MSKRIGILGAGQLGGYLCIAARSLGFETTVLAADPTEMAVALADETLFESGDPQVDASDIAARCDYITFEKEDIAPEALNLLREREAAGEISVSPSVDTMLLLQNKALQKRWYAERDLPTAEFIEIPKGTPTEQLRKQIGSPFVVKTERGGYDGLGVRVIQDDYTADDLGDIPSIAERFIGERRELAVLVVCDQHGTASAYPAVEMVFDPDGNLLRTIVAPANVSTDTADAAEQLALSAIRQLGSAGVFAVELFLSEGDLLINEISPRVHNSGHHTMDAAPTSQFEQHIRAVTGQTAGPISPMQPAALINLLCEPPIHHVCCSDQQSQQEAEQVFVHWYGKKSRRHLRKMGHMTALDVSTEQALARAQAYYKQMSQHSEETSS